MSKGLNIKFNITAPEGIKFEDIKASLDHSLRAPTFRCVFFDGPFHGEVRYIYDGEPKQYLILAEPPRMEDWNIADRNPLLPDLREHHYRLARTFREFMTVLYNYDGPR